MTLIYILIPLFVGGSLLSYVGLMIFYPEWVGITGDNAQKALKEHQSGSSSEDIQLFKEMSDVNKPLSKKD
ncbi:MAG: hypothetical protein K2Q26_06910 [Bdellovibrionales bacterium]|nr:hypothetical protein [Bdellovibrionales bacterium]